MIVYYYIMVFIFGLVIGSFLNVCIYRLPREESVVKVPSHCMNCGTRLKPLDLVPVLSYIFLKGKCRYCGKKVSIRYPMVEMITALTFVLLFSRYSLTVDFAAFAFLMSILIAVFFIDIDHRIIPDELVIVGLIGGAIVFVYNIFYPVVIYSDRSWWNPLLGLVAGAGFLFVIAVIGSIIYKTDEAMGMGDVKIFAPIGVFLGWKMCIMALYSSIVIGGILSLGLIVLRKKKKKDTIPFGPFIVIGTFITIMWGWDVINWYLKVRFGG